MKELEKAYRDIQPKIFTFFFIKTMNRAAAEDLTHDVFFEALKGLPAFAKRSNLETWIFSIAKNRLKNHYRSKKYSANLTERLMQNRGEAFRSAEEAFLLKEEQLKLLRQIEAMDELTKEIVTLRLFGDLSFKEIGELLEKSENYARVRFHRAKLVLQKERRNEE